MGWFNKQVTEPVTHVRKIAQCDGCGTEVRYGDPVKEGAPDSTSIPNGWTTIYRLISPTSSRGAFLACSRACALKLLDKAFA